jgi:hypothetical protein
MSEEEIIRKLCEAVARLEGRDALLEREMSLLAERVKDMSKALTWIKYCFIAVAVDVLTGGGAAKILPLLKGLL